MLRYMYRGVRLDVAGGAQSDVREFLMRARHYGLLALKAQQQVSPPLLVKQQVEQKNQTYIIFELGFYARNCIFCQSTYTLKRSTCVGSRITDQLAQPVTIGEKLRATCLVVTLTLSSSSQQNHYCSNIATAMIQHLSIHAKVAESADCTICPHS
jgi:hypothetical protein